jgi:flagellar L-ring protein FlgH
MNLIHASARPMAALLACLAMLASAGCNTAPRRDPDFAASYPAVHASVEPAQAASGAIFQRGHDITLFEDAKARRIGDILTIRLAESTNAQKQADTAVTRSSDSSIDNPTILGSSPLFDLPGVLPLAGTEDNTLASNLGAEHDFAGAADTQLSNSLRGDLTVTIADVLPNGNLVVRGEKRLNLNQGNEYVKISGIVRPIDIATDNSVPSTKVADATIIYNGDGATADSNRVGWLQRFFTSAVFPF